jgi:hypothetical protein
VFFLHSAKKVFTKYKKTLGKEASLSRVFFFVECFLGKEPNSGSDRNENYYYTKMIDLCHDTDETADHLI